ncbi:hypothetical protein KCU91_g8012, partial [Aureobasidium melanogenum]
MSSSDQSSTGKENDKTRETCRRGPEDGYPFIVDEVFRRPERLPEPVTVRRVSRPAGPHRTMKKVAAEPERSAFLVGNVAERSTPTQVSSTQTPANNSLALFTSGSKPCPRVSEATSGQKQMKDNSISITSADRPASIHTTMPGAYAESDDGGVELPEQITSENNHDAARKVKANDGGEGKLGVQLSYGPGETGAEDSAQEGDKLASIFARLDALNRPRREN